MVSFENVRRGVVNIKCLLEMGYNCPFVCCSDSLIHPNFYQLIQMLFLNSHHANVCKFVFKRFLKEFAIFVSCKQIVSGLCNPGCVTPKELVINLMG